MVEGEREGSILSVGMMESKKICLLGEEFG